MFTYALFACFFFSLTAGLLIAAWVQKGSAQRGSRQAEIGCLGLIFGASIFLGLMILFFAIAVVAGQF